MLERYNGEVKGKFPLGRSPIGEIAIYVILLVQEADTWKRNFTLKTKGSKSR